MDSDAENLRLDDASDKTADGHYTLMEDKKLLAFASEYKFLTFSCLLLLITLWLIVGTIWFPMWWYWAIFTGHLSVWGSVVEGFSLLWQGFRVQLFFIAFVVIGGFVGIVKFRNRLSPLATTYRWPLAACCLATILVNILILNYSQRPDLPDSSNQIQAMLAQSQALLNLVLDRVGNGQAPREIEKPIDFRYLDSKKIQDLYFQIQPTLVEKNRKVSSTGKTHEGAEVKLGREEVGSLGLDMTQDNEKAQISELTRTEDNSAVEALEVINYCLGNHRVAFYSTEEGWRVAYTLRAKTMSRADQEFAKTMKFPVIPKADDTVDESVAQRQIIEESNRDLKDELAKLADLVLIDGSFEAHEAGGLTKLIEHFSKGSNRVDFVVEIPHDSSFKNLGSGGRLRVFGNINHPLDNQGNISIQPIAIF